jgi:hypothetical protein
MEACAPERSMPLATHAQTGNLPGPWQGNRMSELIGTTEAREEGFYHSVPWAVPIWRYGTLEADGLGAAGQCKISLTPICRVFIAESWAKSWGGLDPSRIA